MIIDKTNIFIQLQLILSILSIILSYLNENVSVKYDFLAIKWLLKS